MVRAVDFLTDEIRLEQFRAVHRDMQTMVYSPGSRSSTKTSSASGPTRLGHTAKLAPAMLPLEKIHPWGIYSDHSMGRERRSAANVNVSSRIGNPCHRDWDHPVQVLGGYAGPIRHRRRK